MSTEPNKPTVLTDEIREKLMVVSTASLSSQMQGRGHLNSFMSGLRLLQDEQRFVGVARTLRYLPQRPGMYERFGVDVQRETVESIEPGEVLVMDARNEPDAGTIGDIYAQRVISRGGVGVITDGAIRDTPAIKALGVPVYYRSSNASTFGRRHWAADSQLPIACAGTTVFPGDVVVADGEGVIVIPAEMVEEIAHAAYAMELEETFVVERVAAGASTVGYFPLEGPQIAEYEAWLEARGGVL